MKNLFTLLTLVLLSTASFAGEFEKDLEHFTSITVAGNFEVYLKKGDKPHAKVVNNEKELLDEKIEFVQKGTDLKVTVKGNNLKKMDLKIYITYTKLFELVARSGGWIQADSPLDGDQIELSCGTDGVIKAILACDNVKASISVGGTIRLSGTASYADYKVSTGGFISAVDVVAKSVIGKVSTGGDISCHGVEKMDLKVNTGGTIKYKYDGEDSNYTEKIVISGTIKKFGN